MRTIVTTGDLAEIIYQHQHPEDFSTSCGLSEGWLDLGYKGTKAKIQELYFEGVMIHYGHYTFEEAMTIGGGMDRPLLEMHFNLEGRLKGQVTGFHEDFLINEGEHTFSYVPQPTGFFEYGAGVEMKSLEIILTPRYFERFSNQECRIIDRFMEAIEKQEPYRLPANGKIDPLMKNIIQQILQSPFKGSVKRVYMESKVLELLASQLSCFENLENRCDCNQPSHDREKLYYAKKLLESRLENPPTIYELSRLVGLNEFKLKKGFKAMFGNTVFGYLTEYRLAFARQFLLDTDQPIVNISDMIGYGHQQHFSTAFKRKYGISPSELRK